MLSTIPSFSTRIEDRRGCIEWTLGTGRNIELRTLKVTEPRQGYGTSLLKDMLSILFATPPYYSVFGFTRVNNLSAHAFYRASGFKLTTVEGVYADGYATLFSAEYKLLCYLHLEGKT